MNKYLCFHLIYVRLEIILDNKITGKSTKLNYHWHAQAVNSDPLKANLYIS